MAPVQTIFPEDQMEAVILGLRSFIWTFFIKIENKDYEVKLHLVSLHQEPFSLSQSFLLTPNSGL